MRHGARILKVLNILVLRGLGSGLAVLLTLLVTRHFETSDAARFLLVFNVTTVASVCFRWGLDDVILRRVAAAEAHGEGSRFPARLMLMAHRRVVVWLLVAALFAFATYMSSTGGASRISAGDVASALGASSLIALTACAGRILQGQGKTNRAALILNIMVPGLSVAGLLVIVVADIEVGASQLSLLYCLVALVGYAGVVWGGRSARPITLGEARGNEADRTLIQSDRKAANRLGGVVVAQQALNWGALLIIPAAYGDTLFTSFMVTYKVAILISLVMLAVNFTFAARIVSHFARAEFEELRRLTRMMVMTVAVASVFAAVVVVLARDLVYSFSTVPVRLDGVLAILVIGQTFFALSAVYALVLSMCRDEKFLLHSQGGVALVGVLVFAVVSFTASLEVAAGVIAVTYLVLAVILRFRVRKLLTQDDAPGATCSEGSKGDRGRPETSRRLPAI